MAFLENLFTSGTQGLMVDQKIVYVPVNEDFSVIGEILSYSESTAKITFKKAWDKAATPTVFYAEARYAGKTGIPLSAEVSVGSYAIFHRVGVGNVVFTASQPAFQKDDEAANVNKASFVSFFFPATEE
jgi:hypothetical protein